MFILHLKICYKIKNLFLTKKKRSKICMKKYFERDRGPFDLFKMHYVNIDL